MLKLQFGDSFLKIDFQVGLDCQIIESICVREKLIFWKVDTCAQTL